MDWIGAVTACAAGLAAVFAGVNLYISGRRELDKWTRETLIEIFATFLDASFAHSSACRDFCLASSSQTRESSQQRSVILATHNRETEILTRLRILAPPPVVQAALNLFDAEYGLSEPCFKDDPISIETYYALIRPVHHSRARFIEAARSALGLRKVTDTSSFDKNVRWSTLRRLLNEGETKLS
jgi:hypothetical protein